MVLFFLDWETPETEHLVRYKFLIFLFIAFQNFAQQYPDQKVDSLLKYGIDKILLEDYGSAKKTFKNLDAEFPNLPLGKIYLSAVHIAESVDYEKFINENYVDSLLNSADKQTEVLLKSDAENLWYNYFQALIYAYRAYYNSIGSNLIPAFADGVFSLQYFQKCQAIDNDFEEAKIAKWIYKYWRSAQTKTLNWLPFVNDDRSEAVKQLESSIKFDTYNQYLAINSLLWIYIDYGKSEKAVELANKMLVNYKDSRFFKWALARAYQDISKEKSIEIYQQILTSVQKLKNRNFYNDIVLMHKIAMLYFDLKKYDKAYQLCNEILDFEFNSEEIKDRLEDRIDRVAELKNEIENISGNK